MAILSGVVMGVGMGVPAGVKTNKIYKNAKQLSNQISTVRNIICQGEVNYQQAKRKRIGGWMLLTEDAVEFYGVKGKQGNNIAILLDGIISTGTIRNGISITTAQQTYVFGVVKPDIWKDQLDKAVAG